jgi:hypothetical protein
MRAADYQLGKTLGKVGQMAIWDVTKAGKGRGSGPSDASLTRSGGEGRQEKNKQR